MSINIAEGVYVTLRNFDRWATLLGQFNYFGSTDGEGTVSECRTQPYMRGELVGRWFHKTGRGWLMIPSGVYIKNPRAPRPKAGGYHAPRSA